MAPRRRRSIPNVQRPQTATPPPQPTLTPAVNSQRQLGMLPTVYQSNMKVLLRREPSITAIVDQFSHVCLYNHNGQKWEKHGYEGSMFIFEKSTHPTYGIYILNRMGTDDYIRPIYPEDDMEIIGDYLMCRFYPDFTKTRVNMGLPYPIPEGHRAAFDRELSKIIAPEEQEKDKDKEKRGRSITLGLWMFATDTREPLKEVMMRLHSYVRQGLPYPDEYRYGPGRAPPPNPHLRTASAASVHAPQGGDIRQPTQPNGIPVSHSGTPAIATAMAATANAGSELDKLFSKLLPPPPSVTVPPPPPPTAKSVHDLFATLTGGASATHLAPAPQPPASALAREKTSTSSGRIALLDSIFASAMPPGFSSTGLTQVADPVLPPQPEEIVIVSPKPTMSGLPQILNQDVISTLLGLGPDSRASSAAPSSVGSRRSAQRYEGDNEYSEGDFTSEGEATMSRTIRASAGTTSRGIPTLSVPQTPSSPEAGGKINGSRRIPGDVTPRPPAGGIRLPPTSPPHFQQRTATPNANGKLDVNGPSAPSPAPASGSASRARPLVPFEATSDLWPYPRAPLDDRSFEQDDVVELDFTDTRALSDPVIFSSRLKEKKDKKEKGRKGKKEREREKEREKAEIEKGWDLPTQTQGQPAYHASATGPVAEVATVPSQPVVAKSPKDLKKTAVSESNGHPENSAVNSTSVKDAILGAMLTKTPGASRATLSRNDFVRELLTLIHTDSQFVDGLWQDYLSRAT